MNTDDFTAENAEQRRSFGLEIPPRQRGELRKMGGTVIDQRRLAREYPPYRRSLIFNIDVSQSSPPFKGGRGDVECGA